MCHSSEIIVMKLKSDRRDFFSYVSVAFIEGRKRNRNKKKALSKIKSKNELLKCFGNLFIMHLTFISSDLSLMDFSNNFQFLLVQNGAFAFNMQFCCCFCWQGAIIIHEVYEEGAASKDGRLWAGDQILEVW